MLTIRPRHIGAILATILVILFTLSFTPAVMAQEPEFAPFQTILTNGATDWEYFTIDNESYLAVANGYNGSSRTIDSKIYHWDGASFVEIQKIPTQNAERWEYFTIDGDHYLAVANERDDVTRNVDSKIYRWDGAGFIEFQAILTHGARDWEFFTIDNNHYLIVANNNNGSSFEINSRLYKWDGTKFDDLNVFQFIPTQGAMDWEYFTINNVHYLAVANQSDNSSHNINSHLYRWNGLGFTQFQSIPTNGARNWEYFTINDQHYLVVANFDNDSTENIDSKLYRWNGATVDPVQTIPTHGAIDWEYFTINDQHYLALANNRTAPNNHSIDSRLYHWNGAGFVEFQTILTHGARQWDYFTMGGDHYLALANGDDDVTVNLDSVIYKANFSDLTITKTGPTTAYTGEPVIYTLTVANNGQRTAANLVISDTLPVGAAYVSGGALNGDSVEWSVDSLAPGASDVVQFTVTADQTITNSDYGVTAAGGYTATGAIAVETVISDFPPPSSPMTVYLPFILKSHPTTKRGGGIPQ